MKKIIPVLLCLCIVCAAAILWVQKSMMQPLPLVSTITVELPQGAGIRAFAAKLVELELVKQPLLVRLVARLYGYDKRLKAGEYSFMPGMSLRDVLEKVSSGKVILHRLTLPEGLTTTQMIKILNENQLLSGEVTEQVAEGDLLPETYVFYKGTSRDTLIRNAKKAMQKALADVWNGRAENLPLRSPQELLTLASIVEKETAVGTERGKVASVFVNRLQKGMLLQTDPTVIYALTEGKKDLGRSLKRRDLQIDNPYNTYKYSGLPPAPICHPGLKAMQAVAHPEDTAYFYFVADGKGGHNFAKTLSEHNKNVRAWLQHIRK